MHPSAASSRRHPPEFERAARAARCVLAKTRLRPAIAIVLGSGLGGMADHLAGSTAIAFAKIPGFPRTTVEGHASRLLIGTLGGVAVAAMQGRAHLYEGYTAQEVAFPVRVLWQMGIRRLILTNSAGATHARWRPGTLVLLRDHVNFQARNPLVGPNDARWGPRFPDMSRAYAAPYRAIARTEGRRLGIPLREGVYAAMLGPSYETPAEVRFLRRIGADLVGMSTVAEAIAAHHLGISVLAISVVANAAAEARGPAIHHADVLAVGRRAQARLTALLSAVVPRLAATRET